MSDDAITAESCPRCSRARKPGEEACPRCGLLVRRWRTFRPDADDPAELEALWQRLLVEWDDGAAHDRALDAATNLAALPGLARRYRARLAADDQDQVARDRLQRLAVLVETGARAQAEEQVQQASMFRLVWYLGYFVALAGVATALYALYLALRQH
jgi:hypothetical protein